MGNQLSIYVPSLEYYLNDLEEKYTIEKTIGFGKFLKTLQCVPSADSPFALNNIINETNNFDDLENLNLLTKLPASSATLSSTSTISNNSQQNNNNDENAKRSNLQNTDKPKSLSLEAKYVIKVYIKKHFTAAEQNKKEQQKSSNENQNFYDESELIAKELKNIFLIKEKIDRLSNESPQLHNLGTVLKVTETDKAVYVTRPFFYKSVKDRLSSRPFLSSIEKRFIVYQFFRALHACDCLEMSHGDLSLENAMLTSDSWLYLVDFAPYKPTFLDINDPAAFSFYFDSTATRRCAIAPERFLSKSEIEKINSNKPVSHTADLFSLGCCIYELYCGVPLFTLSTLIQYKKEQISITKQLQRIDEEPLRRLISILCDRDPSVRKSARQWLDDKELFPSHFEYAYDITRQLRSLPTVDDRVQAAQRHLSSIVQLKTVDITSTPPAPAPIDYLPSLSNERNKPSSVARQPSIDERRALEHDVTHAGAGASIRSVDDLAQYDINAQLASILAQLERLNIDRDESEIKNNSNDNNNDNNDNNDNNNNDDNDDNNLESNQDNNNNGDNDDDNSKIIEKQTEIVSNNQSLNQKTISSIRDVAKLLLSVILAHCRHTRNVSARCNVLALLYSLSSPVNVDDTHTIQSVLTPRVVLGRVLPFSLEFLADSRPLVRHAALRLSAQAFCIGVDNVSAYGTHLALDYALPRILAIANDDESDIVLTLLISRLPSIAAASRRYLDIQCRLLATNNNDQNSRESSSDSTALATNERSSTDQELVFDASLDALQRKVYDCVVTALGRAPAPGVAVKLALFENLLELCLFFGRRRTIDLVAPLLITFLNDPAWQLRCAFFSGVLSLAAYIGRAPLDAYLLECVLQKTRDTNARVAAAAAFCLSRLAKLGLLRAIRVRQTIDVVAPLLSSKRSWIVRRAGIQLVTSIASILPIVDRISLLLPAINIHFVDAPTLAILTNENALLDLLTPTLGDQSGVTHCAHVNGLLRRLRNDEAKLKRKLKMANDATNDDDDDDNDDDDDSEKSEKVETVNTVNNKQSDKNDLYFGAKSPDRNVATSGGTVAGNAVGNVTNQPNDLSGALGVDTSRDGSLSQHLKFALDFEEYANLATLVPVYVRTRGVRAQNQSILSMPDSPFHATPSSTTPPSPQPATSPDTASPNPATTSTTQSSHAPHPRALLNPQLPALPSFPAEYNPIGVETLARALFSNTGANAAQSSTANGAPPNNAAATGTTSSIEQLYALGRAKDHTFSALRRYFAAGSQPSPKGVLVAHYAEHRGAVAELAVATDQSYFASGGHDGTVRIFDCRWLEKHVADRSRIVARTQKGSVMSLCCIDTSHSLGVATDGGSLLLMAVDRQSNSTGTMQKYTGTRVVRTEEPREGAVMCVRSFDDAPRARTLLAYATALGGVRCADLRAPHGGSSASAALEFVGRAGLGSPSSLLVDTRDAAWLLCSTTRGYLVLYDLRVGVPLTVRAHSSNAPLSRLAHYYGPGGSGRDDEASLGTARRVRGPAVLYAASDGIIEACELGSGRVTLALSHAGLISPMRLGSIQQRWHGRADGQSVGIDHLAPRRQRRGTGALWPPAVAPMRQNVVSAFASCGNYIISGDQDYSLNVWHVTKPQQSHVMNEAERLEELARREKQQRQQKQQQQQQRKQQDTDSKNKTSSNNDVGSSAQSSPATDKESVAPHYDTRISFRLQSGSKNFRVLHKFTEQVEGMHNPNNSSNPNSPLVPPSTQHNDVITDIQIVPQTQWASQLVVSSARDGVIKVWK